MPLAIALEALKASYRAQIKWVEAQAEEFESGKVRVFSQDKDMTAQTAIDYRHRAANLEGNIRAYERLDAKRP